MIEHLHLPVRNNGPFCLVTLRFLKSVICSVLPSLTAAAIVSSAFGQYPPLPSANGGHQSATQIVEAERMDTTNTPSRPVPQRVAALLADGREGGRLDGRLAWSATPVVETDDTTWSVLITVEIDGSNFLQGHGRGDLEIGVYGYILSADGNLIGDLNQSRTIRPAGMAGKTGLRVVHEMVLPPGRYSMRLLVEDATTQRHFLRTVEINVPAPDPVFPVVLAPLIEVTGEGWVVFGTSDDEPAGASFAVDGRNFLPQTDAVSVSGQTIAMILSGEGWSDQIEASCRVIDADGVDQARPTLHLGDRLGSDRDGRLLVEAMIDSVELPEGRYSLSLRIEDPVSGRAVSRLVSMVVRQSGHPIVAAATDREVHERVSPEPIVLETRRIGSVSAQTVALLLSGQRGGDILGSLIWTVSPVVEDDGLFEVLLFVDTDGRSLIEQNQDSELEVGFFAYIFSNEGRLVAHLAQGLGLDLQTYEQPLLSRGLKFAGRVSLKPGAYFARLLVRNQNSGRVFLTQARIDIPSGQNDQRLLLPPLFEETRGGWVVARQGDIGDRAVGVELDETRLLPASRVVVESRKYTKFILGGSGWSGASRLTARVSDSQGRQLAEPMLSIDRRIGDGDGVIRFFGATLSPLDLPSGFYTLEVALSDEATGARLSRYVPLAVVEKREPLVLEASVPEMRGLIPSQGIGESAAELPLTGAGFAARYADALYLLGTGDRFGARDSVVELERMVVDGGGLRDLAMLSRVERQVIRNLAATNPGVLRPLCLLHRDVYRRYLALDDDRLADTAWPLAADLAEEAWDRQSREGADFASTLLVSLAADLVGATAVDAAIELLDRAIAIEPDNPSALLALGATYERSGRYEEAIRPLETLVREHPENSEGELRLAINLARSGDTGAAKRHFRALIEGSTPTWISVIAYQELARLLTVSAAYSLLNEAVTRYPGNQALQVQFAFTLDQSGRTEEAAKVVETLCRRSGAPETSPRVRYPAWPALGLGGRMIELERETETFLPALVTALGERAHQPPEEDAT